MNGEQHRKRVRQPVTYCISNACLLGLPEQAHFKIMGSMAEEIAQWLRACNALAEDPSSVPRTHVRWLTTTSSKSLMPSSGLHDTALPCTNPHIHTHNLKQTLRTKQQTYLLRGMSSKKILLLWGRGHRWSRTAVKPQLKGKQNRD